MDLETTYKELRDFIEETRDRREADVEWKAKISERLEQERVNVDTLIELVRGDGNGKPGLVSKITDLRYEISTLSTRLAATEKALDKATKSPALSAIAERGKWKLATTVIVGVTSVLTAGLTALVAALMK